MQTQKVFIKKTRRGNIIKVVREHYLRDDILPFPDDCALDKKPVSKSRLVSRKAASKTCVSISFVV